MKLQTTSEAISFLRQLEKQSADFYERLAKDHEAQKDLFLGFVKENGKYVNNIERTYYGVITDALEGCYAFAIETDMYKLDDKLTPGGSYADALYSAVQMESTIRRFYIDAAKQSQCLMADVPRVMERIAKSRQNRIDRIGEIAAKAALDIT